jgi:hypothetical protein
MAAHGLRKLRVASVNGALFGTLADDVEPLEDYLGPPVLAQRPLCASPTAASNLECTPISA